MSSSPGVCYDGLDERALAARLGLPRVVVLQRATSTMDHAHALAADGAPSGTLVLAHEQSEGRGRSGARWLGATGTSILCTIIERVSPSVLDVLSLRVGLMIAQVLDSFAGERVRLKWPNDIFVRGGKLAGVLIETRWREGKAEWVAVAAGLNVSAVPDGIPSARSLRAGTARLKVLGAVIPAMRNAALCEGELTAEECAAWRERDFLMGRRVSAPEAGVVSGILPTGELLIETPAGMAAVRSGSVRMEEG